MLNLCWLIHNKNCWWKRCVLSLCVCTYICIYRHTLFTNVCFSAIIYSCAPVEYREYIAGKQNIYKRSLIANNIQGGSNVTGTDFCVNKPHMSRSYLNHLVQVPGNIDSYYFVLYDLQLVLFQMEQSSGRLQS